MRMRRKPKEPVEAYQSPQEFEEHYQQIKRTSRRLDLYSGTCMAVVLVAIALNLWVGSSRVLLALLCAAFGANVGSTIVRHRGMAKLAKVREEGLLAAAAMAGDLLGAMAASPYGPRLVALATPIEDGEEGRSPFDDEMIGPGHPAYELLQGAIEHGHVYGELVRTEDGWEVLHGRYSDGTEFGPHEPPHEERLADG